MRALLQEQGWRNTLHKALEEAKRQLAELPTPMAGDHHQNIERLQHQIATIDSQLALTRDMAVRDVNALLQEATRTPARS